ncbi:MAG: hypothetical protein IPI73_08555 [Betaproteobacteria bacterium]|nr:hypothetical protein [Betaproteobacteria bacterium]
MANYQTALRDVRYSNSSENPSTLSRTVTFQANDGAVANNLSNLQMRNITVIPGNDPPVLTAGAALGYTENEAPKVLDGTVTVNDVDNTNLASAKVQITGNCGSGEDVLGFSSQNGITGNYTAATCTLDLTGSATLANYQAALRSVTYSNSSDNPGVGLRTVTWTGNDGTAPGVGVTSTILITAVNDAPVVTAGSTVNYTEDAPAVAIDATLTVNDVDSVNLASATVDISGNCVVLEDVLSFTPQFGITGSYVPATCVLSLSGRRHRGQLPDRVARRNTTIFRRIQVR